MKLKNGFDGSKSLDTHNSLMSKLLLYIKATEHTGGAPTRVGFARTRHSEKPENYGKGLVRVALAEGFITAKGRNKHGVIYTVGPNADKVFTLSGYTFEQCVTNKPAPDRSAYERLKKNFENKG